MVRKISEIYAEYKIMPNLQMHMYRVAAVASLIYDNFNEPLNKEEIITACLLHDMGNIITNLVNKGLVGTGSRDNFSDQVWITDKGKEYL